MTEYFGSQIVFTTNNSIGRITGSNLIALAGKSKSSNKDCK